MGATYIISAYILFGRHLAVKKTRKYILKLGSLYPSSKVLMEEERAVLRKQITVRLKFLF